MLPGVMIAETLRSNMLTLARTYARGTNTKLSTVSKRFYGLTDFFDDFALKPKAAPNGSKKTGGKHPRKRASISIDKYGEVVGKMREEWPDGVPWPILDPVIFLGPEKK